jgi:hypothetical protein
MFINGRYFGLYKFNSETQHLITNEEYISFKYLGLSSKISNSLLNTSPINLISFANILSKSNIYQPFLTIYSHYLGDE